MLDRSIYHTFRMYKYKYYNMWPHIYYILHVFVCLRVGAVQLCCANVLLPEGTAIHFLVPHPLLFSRTHTHILHTHTHSRSLSLRLFLFLFPLSPIYFVSTHATPLSLIYFVARASSMRVASAVGVSLS